MAEHRENYRITATNQTDRALAEVQRNFEGVNRAVNGVQAAMGRLAGVAVLVTGFTMTAKAASEAEIASNRLTAVLRATGNAAGMTKKELDDLAESMAGSTIFDDESIRGAEATLLKFGNIQTDVFRRGMGLAADYASFVGSDIQEAAQAIGKALQSPDEGITSLERQVGKLTFSQKENIKTFMEQGRVMEAQRVVLDALDKKIGGTAALINSGVTKGLKDVTKNVDELAEAIGKTGPAITIFTQINKALVEMKRIVEDGDWVAALKSISVWGYLGDSKTKPKTGAVSGVIKGGPADPAIAALQAQIDAAREAQAKAKANQKPAAVKKEMSFDELLAQAALKRLQVQEQAEQDGERAAEEHRKELERQRQTLTDLIDPTAQYVKLLQQFRDLHAEGAITTNQLVEAEFVLNEKIDEAVAGTRKLNDEAEKGSDIARDLGLTFSSAFEDAITGGKAFREVLQGILSDILRIAARKLVTEPLGNAITNSLGGFNLGKLFGGGGDYTPPPLSGVLTEAGMLAQYADGTDYVPRTGLALIHQGEAVIPASENAKRDSGGVTVIVNNQSGVPMAARASSPRTVDGRTLVDVVLTQLARDGDAVQRFRSTLAAPG